MNDSAHFASPPGPQGPGAKSRVPGARVRSPGRPVVTYGILALTTAVFLLQLIPGLHVTERLGFSPSPAAEEPWRFFTAALVHMHPNPMHLAFNMLGVYFFGSFLERHMGHVPFAVVYVLAALGGSVCVLLLADPFDPQSWFALHIGASGAVFGLLGVLLAPAPIGNRNIGGVLTFIGLNALYLLVEPNISWQSHLGGMVTGFLLGCAFFCVPPRLRTPVFSLVAVGILVASGAVAAAVLP